MKFQVQAPLLRLFLPLLLLVGLASLSACDSKANLASTDEDKTENLQVDKVTGSWWLAYQLGGFRAGPPPTYTLEEMTEQVTFGDDGTLVVMQRDSSGKMVETLRSEFTIDSSGVDPYDSIFQKVSLSLSNEEAKSVFTTLWFNEKGELITMKDAPAYDGVANYYQRLD